MIYPMMERALFILFFILLESERLGARTRSMAAPRIKTRFWSDIVDGEVRRK